MSDFGINEQTLDLVLQDFNFDRKSLQQNVEIVKEWLQTQKHLPEIMDERKIRNFLLLNKGSIEITKKKIDMYYTVRSLIPELFKVVNPKNEAYQKVAEFSDVVILPKLFLDKYRIIYMRVNNPELMSEVNPNNFLSVLVNLWEIRLNEDCPCGDYFVIDMKDIKIDLVSKWTPMAIKKDLIIQEGIYSLRIKGIIIFNSSSILNGFLMILKAIVKKKIFDRIHNFTEGPEILKNFFPDDMIPKEYGGVGPTLQELRDLKQKYMKKYEKRFDELDNLRVNEDLRPVKLENDEFLGYYGNFKKLDVD